MTRDEEAAAPLHYLGYRERLHERFRKGGADALAEYELIELILFRAMPRRDVKPLAKNPSSDLAPLREPCRRGPSVCVRSRG